MDTDRRRLLLSAPMVLLASSMPPLLAPALAAKPRFKAALLVPGTGPHAALGRSMTRAAAMAQGVNSSDALAVFDAGDTEQAAAIAARAARKAGATIVIGPVFSRQVRTVLDEFGGSAPIVTFSNDEALIESGAFVFGITARQTAASILEYASGRGIRRIAVGGLSDGWGAQVQQATLSTATSLGLECHTLPSSDMAALSVVTSSSLDGLPDAVLMSDPDLLARLAPDLTRQGVQMLGAFQGLDLTFGQTQALNGAWLAAPDPVRFDGFVRSFEQRNGPRPGAIAALAYDAAAMVGQLMQSGGTDRSALLAATGFKGICGEVKFRDDGSVARSLAILGVSAQGLRTIAPSAAG